ncbi:porin [Methylomonas sp. MO1]|uniref:porin n=1 Tax=Methylomonas sp. MO1 TaxID=3073619 RepID=UPI0028A50B4B|nr:porin [Methylomonas sp. MO1]MDT4290963.1 porin [Methylomonas sp. MO1]
MRNNTTLTKSHSRACLAGLMVICSASAMADSWTEASGLLGAAGIDPNEAKFMKDHNLKIGGWLNASIGANMHSNSDGFNGPVTFNDRTGEPQMNQLNLYLQKAITVSGDAFDIGGRVDVMYGTDAAFTQAYGSFGLDPGDALTSSDRGNWDLNLSGHGERFYGLALPQAYAEFNLPFGNGIAVKAGHFYTPIGYEVVTAPDNFFITKPYTMQYGEPFTHTGILATYAYNPNWTVMGGAVTGSNSGGWDGNWDRDLGNWAWLGGVTWTSDDAGTSLAITSTAGDRSENSNDTWAIYSIVGKHNFTDKLHYIIQHDHGFANNIWTASAAPNGTATQDAEWYGINQYLIYDINDKVSAGVRAEWFRDHNGIRVYGPGRCYAAAGNEGANFACGGNYLASNFQEASGYYAVTAGMSYKPAKWLNLRPNVRYDFTDNAKAFDNGTRHNQFLVTADVVITF